MDSNATVAFGPGRDPAVVQAATARPQIAISATRSAYALCARSRASRPTLHRIPVTY